MGKDLCLIIITQTVFIGATMKKLIKLPVILLLGVTAYADIGDMAASINSTFAQIAALVGGAAYLAGIILVLSALFKFKQHRDNPQQVQLGTCFTLLFIGILMIFLPNLITQAGGTVFSSDQTSGGVSGSGFSDLS